MSQGISNDSSIIRISYSMLSAFKNCRKLVEYKYVKGYEAPSKSPALAFGTTVHKALEKWYTCRNLPETIAYVKEDFASHDELLIAQCMLEAYVSKYRDDDLEIISLEKKFDDVPIYDVDTKKPIPGVTYVGVFDGIVKKDGEYFLLEHKTAAKMEADYLEKLWNDFQITLYCYYANKVFGYKCAGVLYNVLVKPDFKRSVGESDEAFELRRLEACKKNKSGKTNIVQKKEETDIEYITRLQEFYQSPYSIHREELYISKQQQLRAITEVSELTHAYLNSIKRGRFYMNTDFCFRYGRCQFFEACKSNGNPNVMNNLYEKRRTPLSLLESYVPEDVL